MNIVKTGKITKAMKNQQISVVPVSIGITGIIVILITILIWKEMIFFLLVPLFTLGIGHLIEFPH